MKQADHLIDDASWPYIYSVRVILVLANHKHFRFTLSISRPAECEHTAHTRGQYCNVCARRTVTASQFKWNTK